ncbi:cytochrome c biogenesis protein CcdA [Phormidium tenue]|uniref:Cytochrome C biogenesis protein n=1 Tax=Phormidium tenue NIES-30 TaxID=549789 RepID=A0A1U7JAW1_9CYAN|nr:cytochrome c biogenesis protein CcdA [Phormidium tenue]MBD2230360.1 cytochrome c biogenesis protein CcdA [Phormidium tenue FACHB-1052]OKH50840.1 cytochrome C biogenesis protein [Phormidium tenue NIES-30]
MSESLQIYLYEIAQWANQLVSEQLTQVSWVSLSVVGLAGLLTSLSPCLLSMLPIMVGYMGGYEERGGAIARSLSFALGLATTLALLGLIAGLFGYVYGQVAWGLPIVVSLVAIVMGLNLLGVIPLALPAGVGPTFENLNLPPWLRAYALGLTFGIVASPCSTPVLATLLAWISTTKDPVLGGALLLAYAVGYVTPLVLAGTFTASLKRLLNLRQWSSWVTPASGALLLGFGVFSLLSRLLPTSLV